MTFYAATYIGNEKIPNQGDCRRVVKTVTTPPSQRSATSPKQCGYYADKGRLTTPVASK